MTNAVMMVEEHTPMADLDQAACWELLRRNEFGRLAYVLDGRLDMAPINYAVHQDRIIFRTAAGSKLSGVLTGGEVVFEIEEMAGEHASSVIIRGTAREMSPEEARWTDQMRLRPWVPTLKEHVIVIEATSVTGRRFDLYRPWTSMRPHR